jgi:hypothetical protein
MRRTFAALLLVGLSVGIACADEKPAPPPSRLTTLTPENDWRLAKRTGAQPQKIGILTYYLNKGGGYTFLRGERVEFYSLPNMPTTYKFEYFVLVMETVNGKPVERRISVQTDDICVIGTSTMSFGGQTLFRSKMRDTPAGTLVRVDTPLAKWSRDAPGEKFRLSILDDDRETRLKLKSIVPALEKSASAR